MRQMLLKQKQLRWTLLSLAGLTCGWGTSTTANADEAPPDETANWVAQYTTPADGRKDGKQVGDDVDVQVDVREHAMRNRARLDFDVGVPIWVTTDDLDPGVMLRGTLGYEMGALVPFLRFGWMWNSTENGGLFDGQDDDLSRLYGSAGLRLQAVNRTIFTPYIAGAVDFNWWRSGVDDDYEYATGISTALGFDFEVGPGLGLGFGADASMTFADGPFDDREWWVTPYARLSALF